MLGGQICPWCRKFTPLDESRCEHCERWVPPPPVSDVLREILKVEYPVTKILLGANIIVYGLEMIFSRVAEVPKMSGAPNSVSVLFGGIPTSVLLRTGALATGLEQSEPWRLITACFVHGGIIHLGMNMMGLVDLGRGIEPRAGSGRFTLAYLFSGLMGYVASVWWYGTKPYITVGASGAIYGLMGFFLVELIFKKHPAWKEMLIRTILFGALMGYAMPINNSAHIGGALAGALCGFLASMEKRPWTKTLYLNWLAAGALIASLITLVLPHRSKVWRDVQKVEKAREEWKEIERMMPSEPDNDD